MTSMFYVYISLWAGARSRKPIVQRCIDDVLTTLTLGTPLGVCCCHSPDEVPTSQTRNCECIPVAVL